MSDDPIELLKRLVAIDSVNPDLVPGGAGETAIADFCGAWLTGRGFDVHRLEERPGRPSIVGIAKGSGGGRSLMFNGHFDTVTLAGYDGDPLDPKVDGDGKLHGRGSFDMKGGVVAMMVAATSWLPVSPTRNTPRRGPRRWSAISAPMRLSSPSPAISSSPSRTRVLRGST